MIRSRAGVWLVFALAMAGCLPGRIRVGGDAGSGDDTATPVDDAQADAAETDAMTGCVGDACGACGIPGGPCCEGNQCAGGLACAGGTCVACGGLGQACCNDPRAACGTGAVCGNGICIACGAAGQSCCDPDATCSAGSSCVDSTCIACGQPGQPCCANNTCSDGVVCGVEVICQ